MTSALHNSSAMIMNLIYLFIMIISHAMNWVPLQHPKKHFYHQSQSNYNITFLEINNVTTRHYILFDTSTVLAI